ncbi:glutamyl-queuosine tRNA(Asp) synthetase [Bordetella holmesii 30539]|uniref:Glutamyl-Q tRNA(Asp) synthetase n=1 Tax=Bordetella holmesii 1058 TaxID=1247648 RepID=A0ABN0S3L0_9BORD|nr:glutamyl-queuosine tRNA(Asp) synthetase [Bordetella holmesii ATCC 51541]EWM41597.1 glutamyl-queuosine tRNA(Asp) synthetase [Bordetella holmesii 41130]EWM46726.1 glutamyl-queuosine tRNA(Asp) synthetase [Bordetella holmesii 35009]EWM50894.1 glutamyl-queuosine tRNA(Asp) synthetase [Bordetella holmesii 70147]EXF89760.1 glutamyl-queuosine tRNA(Asp) synthetase [Bordetella holmesii 30539]EXX95969.1 glutamyl-queuosine tRNA(Asp) synthetase [Bordetella holmesii 1058]SUV90863.1 glutamyl-tRNA syntheta
MHAGSLVAALASWLDARAHQGRWLLRIEDVDKPRAIPGADAIIMQQLRDLGLHWQGEVLWQSRRDTVYQAAFDCLRRAGQVYGCGCTRREIADSALRGAAGVDGERPYPGTCRHGLAPGRQARAWRLRVPAGVEHFEDRWLGPQSQDVALAVGDFVLKRADGLWAYQLAVVVDDGQQGVTDIVRGADLLGSTARQRLLARLLGLPAPRVMHLPLVIDPQSGLKLSKQNHAPALDTRDALGCLTRAWRELGFDPLPARDRDDFLARATGAWGARFGRT